MPFPSDVLLAADPRATLDAVAALDAKSRKAAVKWLVEDWKNGVGRGWSWDGGTERFERWGRLVVALTAAAAEPKQALSIPVPTMNHGVGITWKTDEGLHPVLPAAIRAALAQAAIDHGTEWCAAWLDLIADERKPRPMYVDVILAVAHAHGLPLPQTPTLAALWAVRFFSLLPNRRDESVRQHVAGALALERVADRWVVTGLELRTTDGLEALRAGHAGAQAGPLLLTTLDHRDGVLLLTGRYMEADAVDQAFELVDRMIACGAVDANELARRAIAALSRGDAVRAQRLQARLLLAAAPGAAFVHGQARLLLSLIAGGADVAAKTAQELLRDADADQPLADDLFVDLCRVVFARKEKGLRATQLAWASKRAATPELRAAAVMGLCEAFGSSDPALHVDAAKAIARLWPGLAPYARPTVIRQLETFRANTVDAVFQPLWAACADTPPPKSPAQAPAVVPRSAPPRPGLVRQPFARVADPSHLPADVMHALGLDKWSRAAWPFERAVAAAMDALHAGDTRLAGSLARRLRTTAPFWMSIAKERYAERSTVHLAWARTQELCAAIARQAPQVFLSVPDFAHGAIAPASLVDRLRQLARSGQRALPVDFVVALLRTEQADAAALEALRAIGSPDSAAAAQFLEAGGAAQLTTQLRRTGAATPAAQRRTGEAAEWASADGEEVCVALAPLAVRPPLDGVPAAWADGFEPEDAPIVSEFDMVADWITPMLPNDAEALTAMFLWGFRRAGKDLGVDGGKAVARRLPLFLDAHGPAGPAVHLAVLFCLSANDAPVRIVGSDGLVTLLQQGRFDAPLAARLVADTVACGSVKAGRLAASLAQAVEAGEAEAVWPLVRAALVAALGMSPAPSGTADLAELAIRLASQLSLREPVPALAAATAAVKGKPNKLQAALLRLHEALGG